MEKLNLPEANSPNQKNTSYEYWRWKTFAITWLIYATYYLTRKSFAIAKVAFADDPNVTLTREQFGIVDSCYLIAYMLGQFMWGPLGDRLGPRRILILGMMLGIGAAVACGFSTGFFAFAIFMIIQGLGQSTGWSNTVKTMSSWFSVKERGRIMGWWCTNYAIGAAIALPFAALAMNFFGYPSVEDASKIIPYWPAGFWTPAAILGIVMVLTIILLRNQPEDVGLVAIEKYHKEAAPVLVPGKKVEDVAERSWDVVKQVLRIKSVWMLAFSYFSIKLTRYALYFWGPKYISECLGSGALESGITAAALPIGGVFGVLVSGYLSDKVFQSRRMPITILSLLSAVAVLMLGLFKIDNNLLMGMFFFVIGFFMFGPDSIISATAAMDFGTRKGAATAAGIINGVGSIGGILGGFLPGVITTEENWTPLFWVFIIGLLVSATILAPMWHKKPPQTEEG
jgi:OPA family sugar phosphate sensor protein UhpC-like MFS transporter